MANTKPSSYTIYPKKDGRNLKKECLENEKHMQRIRIMKFNTKSNIS
jgi:hypothetical protein